MRKSNKREWTRGARTWGRLGDAEGHVCLCVCLPNRLMKALMTKGENMEFCIQNWLAMKLARDREADEEANNYKATGWDGDGWRRWRRSKRRRGWTTIKCISGDNTEGKGNGEWVLSGSWELIIIRGENKNVKKYF